MKNIQQAQLLEQFSIDELEDRIEFGLCGGSGGGDGGDGGSDPVDPCVHGGDPNECSPNEN